MSEASKYQNNLNFGSVGNVNTGDVTVAGDQVGIQHNYAPSQNLAEAAKDIQDLLAELERTYPTMTEAQKQEQAIAVQKAHLDIKRDPSLRDRLWNALKAGGVEALKQALDTIYKNPLVSISVETIKGFLEAECRE
jgi:phosphoenolpyruvate-protein kinase (PTS system EI component)